MYTISYILNCAEKQEYGHNHNVDRWQTWLVVDIALVCTLMSVFTFFNKLENIKTMVLSVTLILFINKISININIYLFYIIIIN